LALGDERNSQPELLAPERQPAFVERACELALERPVHLFRIAPDRLITDEQSPQDHPDQDEREADRGFAT
jgi:hypothetical protein